MSRRLQHEGRYRTVLINNQNRITMSSRCSQGKHRHCKGKSRRNPPNNNCTCDCHKGD